MNHISSHIIFPVIVWNVVPPKVGVYWYSIAACLKKKILPRSRKKINLKLSTFLQNFKIGNSQPPPSSSYLTSAKLCLPLPIRSNHHLPLCSARYTLPPSI